MTRMTRMTRMPARARGPGRVRCEGGGAAGSALRRSLERFVRNLARLPRRGASRTAAERAAILWKRAGDATAAYLF